VLSNNLICYNFPEKRPNVLFKYPIDIQFGSIVYFAQLNICHYSNQLLFRIIRKYHKGVHARRKDKFRSSSKFQFNYGFVYDLNASCQDQNSNAVCLCQRHSYNPVTGSIPITVYILHHDVRLDFDIPIPMDRDPNTIRVHFDVVGEYYYDHNL